MFGKQRTMQIKYTEMFHVHRPHRSFHTHSEKAPVLRIICLLVKAQGRQEIRTRIFIEKFKYGSIPTAVSAWTKI
jgi:hypothetical protein